MDSYFSDEELQNLGFASVGKNVRLSRKASIYSFDKISIGSNVRIDDFCILSGKIIIRSNIHIAPYSGLFGGSEGITLCDFSNISSKVTIYAVSDDYSGEMMTNAAIPLDYRHMIEKPVLIEKHVIVGSGCVILPGCVLREGSAFGAMTLINHDSEQFSINAGIPFRKIKERSHNLLNYERLFIEQEGK